MFNMMQPPQKYPGQHILAVVTLQTFYLSKLDLLTVYLGKLDFLKGYSITKTVILRKDSLWPYYKILIK